MGDHGKTGRRKAAKPLRKGEYKDLLAPLQLELVRMAEWLQATGLRLVVLFEGRDTAGKGGAIKALTEHLNPRQCRIAALPRPTDREATQWYFQRYAAHLPAAGEMTLFDRSWYNRAGVERVMGYCSQSEHAAFLRQAPQFERMLVDDGIALFKYWLCVDQAEQEQRFAERHADPLKGWKLSPVDLEARHRYADYTRAREEMLAATHTAHAPWTLVDFNDQRVGRLTLLRDLLDRLPDVDVPSDLPVLEPLRGKARRERYGVLEPIAPYPSRAED
ncbi:polyphosphate kinase 2 [Pseudoxanthomonas daejeonensis]|uniref:polyphosphate kinase 2 n=1 Tax=Pseudoxanthomonas daejeonensis TaxID=266062 RepID=UPI001F543B0A|nr:polyphosphate kinase 2 [Pseudoxanthomonas daejeonensis]UNK58044.1 polyphosphate kinase 2 [Pseudoxanthomonas daejeonensis]